MAGTEFPQIGSDSNQRFQCHTACRKKRATKMVFHESALDIECHRTVSRPRQDLPCTTKASKVYRAFLSKARRMKFP